MSEARVETKEEAKLKSQIKLFGRFGWGFVILGGIISLHGLIIFFWGTSPIKLNELGDYLGGTVASSWALAGLFFIYVAFLGQKLEMIYQREELGLTRKELEATRDELRGQREQMTLQNESLKLQNFENTFFQLIRLHNEIVSQLDVGEDPQRAFDRTDRMIMNFTSSGKHTGRDCFSNFYKSFKSIYKRLSRKEEYKLKLEVNYPDYKEIYSIVINESYETFFKEFQSDVGHYFRSLYHIFKFIDNSNVQDKTFYTNIVRAQLSSYELLLLFYNCLSKKGNKQFKILVERFSILENIPSDELISIDHKNILYDPKAFSDSH